MKDFEHIGDVPIGKIFLLNGRRFERKNTPVGNGCTTGMNRLAVDADGDASITEKIIPVIVCS